MKNKAMNLLYLEQKNKCYLIKISHQIINAEEYQLSRKYKEKFCSIYKLANRIMNICRKITLLFVYIVIFILTLIAYFDSEMNFSAIIMLIWSVIIVISYYYATSFCFIAGVYTYLTSLYMKYRFQQVQDLIEIYLKRGNTFQTILYMSNFHINPFHEKIKYLMTCIYEIFKYIALNT